MSQYLLPRLNALAPYVPGEQPQDKRYIKLNTNESPFPPAPGVMAALSPERIAQMNLYPDPLCERLTQALANEYGLLTENVFVGNGSDEVLGFAFMAYTDESHPVTIPSVSYGFYEVYAKLYGCKAYSIDLNEDFTIPVEKFFAQKGMVALANPNAPTALALPRDEIERIVKNNPEHPVLIDEAYVDFGGETCLPLLTKYPNLLIVRTFSKSRSLAGGRLGYAMGSREMIADLNRVKFSFHPYNINSLTMAAGIAAVEDKEYFGACVAAIRKTREATASALRELGFMVTNSATNFLFAGHPELEGRRYYELLKQKGVLVRFLGHPSLKGYVRITIGSDEQMAVVLQKTREILSEVGLC